jgi:replication factor C small subunit
LGDEAISSRLEYVSENEGVKLTKTGKEAILYLSDGDMRSAINLLQAAASSGQITDNVVFAISGRANPEKIKNLLNQAYNGEFNLSLEHLRDLINHEGVSPIDLTRQIHRELQRMELDSEIKRSSLERTAEIEFRIAGGANGEVQLASLLAHFSLGRERDE